MESGESVLILIALAVLLVSVSETTGENLREVTIAQCAPEASDYTLSWWAKGWPDAAPGREWLRCVETGKYGFGLNVEALQIKHLGVFANAIGYEAAANPEHNAIYQLPPADLELVIKVADREYRCIQGGKAQAHSGPRIIESGRYLQRQDITDLVFKDETGNRLNTQAWFEVIALPERLSLLFEVLPNNTSTPVAGENFEISLHLKTGDNDYTVRQSGEYSSGKPLQVTLTLEPVNGEMKMPQQDAFAPLNITAQDIANGNQLPVTIDTVYGWVEVNLNETNPQGDFNDALERTRLTLENPDLVPRKAYLFFNKDGSGFKVNQIPAVTGISPVLCDSTGVPSGVPVQSSKNWHAQPDMFIKYQGPWLHGVTLLQLPPRSRLTCELAIAYAHWGGVAAASHAQLCLVGWGSNQLWDEAAIGAWGESICYDPDQIQVANIVCDVRPLMVNSMVSNEPIKWQWTNNVGGADFLRIFDTDERRFLPSSVRTAYSSQGPCLTDVSYNWLTGDGAIVNHAAVSLYRTNDITRGIYRVRMDVKKPVDFSRLVFFQVGSDTYSYTGERKMALGNESGMQREWATNWGSGEYRTNPVELTGKIPWVSLHEAERQSPNIMGAWANRGIIIREWSAKIGGQIVKPYMAEYAVRANGVETSVADILAPPGVTHLESGDYLEATFEHIIMPQYAKDYYGPNEQLRKALEQWENTWAMVYREAVGNDIEVSITRGTLERHTPLMIQSSNNQAEFTLTGGLGYVPITISGLDNYVTPILELKTENGVWLPVNQAVHGNDFWQTDRNPLTGKYSITFTLPSDTSDDSKTTREYRFSLG